VSQEKRFFSPESFWNQPIAADADVHAKSRHFVDLLHASEATSGLHINLHEWTIPIYPVDSTTPVHHVAKRLPWHEGEGRDFYAYTRPFLRTEPQHPLGHGPGFGRNVPIPDFATPDPEGDAHMALIDRDAGKAWDMWAAGKTPDGTWWSCTGMQYDLGGSGAFEAQSFSIHNGESIHLYGPSRASGTPAIAGMVMHHEILAGRIEHKLAFGCSACAHLSHYFPAIWTDGGTPNGIPQGIVMQLDPAIEIENLDIPVAGKVIAKALQEFGAVLVDNAGGVTLYGEGLWWDDSRQWEGLLEEEDLRAIRFDHLRFIKPTTPEVQRGMALGPNPGILRGFQRHVGYAEPSAPKLRSDFADWDKIEL